MRWSGPILVLFIVYHLLHFTVGTVHPAFVDGDVYRNVIVGFSVWPVSLALRHRDAGPGLHLRHGAWSMLQTLGASHPRWNGVRNAARDRFHRDRRLGVHLRSAGGLGRRLEVGPAPWSSARTSPTARSTRSGPGTGSR